MKFFIVSIFFKNIFWREIKLWVLLLFTDLIGRLGVTGKLEGSKGVCWVSGIITVSRLDEIVSRLAVSRLAETVSGLAEMEDVQLI